jgi:hypothetical protein
VKLFDVLLGRTKAVQPNLDHLFGLPGAEITLEASLGLHPTGQAGVCFKPATGQQFADTTSEVEQLLDLGDGAKIHEESDSYGYRWVVIADADFGDLINQVHVINTTLQDHGWGPQLLCSVFSFEPIPGGAADAGAATGAQKVAGTYLVYLYKRGTFYPFVPLPAKEKRDSDQERLLKVTLATDLEMEPDLERWFPLWGLPVH